MEDLFDDDTPQQKGGKARAEKLSPEQRREIARKGASARWALESNIPKATHGSADQPLQIGDIQIECYVLETGVRVLSQRSMIAGTGFSRGGPRHDGEIGNLGAELPRFAGQSWLKDHISSDLTSALKSPILFRLPSGAKAYGYPATILADICDAVLDARSHGKTGPRQEVIVHRCETLIRGFARVGIVALVDEATGYQEIRDRKALEEILNSYIAKELQKWTPTFPDDYFHNIFRLKGWQMPQLPTVRPGIIGHYTKDIVYSRLAPGVLKELEQLNPTDGKGQRKHKHHQHLTRDHGHPKLKDHLRDVVLLMRASDGWHEFKRLLDRTKPRVSAPGELPFNPGDDDE